MTAVPLHCGPAAKFKFWLNQVSARNSGFLHAVWQAKQSGMGGRQICDGTARRRPNRKDRHMSRTLKLSTTLMAAGFLLLSPVGASAEETTCRGTIGDRTVDNLRVPQSATCTLNGTRVKGTIKVERNAVLVANDVVVIGNVQAENAKNVKVRDGSRVSGSVQVVQGGGATVADSKINADILYDENSAPLAVL